MAVCYIVMALLLWVCCYYCVVMAILSYLCSFDYVAVAVLLLICFYCYCCYCYCCYCYIAKVKLPCICDFCYVVIPFLIRPCCYYYVYLISIIYMLYLSQDESLYQALLPQKSAPYRISELHLSISSKYFYLGKYFYLVFPCHNKNKLGLSWGSTRLRQLAWTETTRSKTEIVINIAIFFILHYQNQI